MSDEFDAEEQVNTALYEEFLAKNRINFKEVNEARRQEGKPESRYSEEEQEHLAIINAVSHRKHIC